MDNKEWFIERYHKLGSNLTGDEGTHQAIRVNPLKTTNRELVEILTSLGVELEKIPYLDHGYKINVSHFSLGASIEYLLGMYSLQESASQYSVQVLKPSSSDRVLDMTSAPGGKTTQIAAYMQNQGIVVAVDINRTRLYATENNIERCGVINTSIHHIDVLDLPRKPVFTKILLDAPCSGNYVTDSQWFNRRTPENIQNNAKFQRQLISCAIELLEIGGTLIYSTCSLEYEENELNIQWLLENHDVELIKIDGPGEQGLTQILEQKIDPRISYCRRFWPDKTGTQGFFIAKVVKQ